MCNRAVRYMAREGLICGPETIALAVAAVRIPKLPLSALVSYFRSGGEAMQATVPREPVAQCSARDEVRSIHARSAGSPNLPSCCNGCLYMQCSRVGGG